MAGFKAGYTTTTFKDSRRNRPVLVDLWYPAEETSREAPFDYRPGFGIVAEGAGCAVTAAPCVILSHGAFGAARNYSWIAERLARSGYVVAGASHYGESFVYGPQTIDPLSALQPWQRALDCSFVLDQLTADARFGSMMDDRRIGALGHSSGGATALELAGAELDLAAMRRYCRSEEAAEDRGCQYARQQGAAPPAAFPWQTTPRRLLDGRIKAVVAMDPALGPGHTDASLGMIEVPTLVVGAVQNDFLPYEHHAARYARLIRGAQHLALSDGEGHFVFLNEGTSEAQANGVPLYKDRNGVDRARVHETLARSILPFLDTNLPDA